jgi:hypothetical protein
MRNAQIVLLIRESSVGRDASDVRPRSGELSDYLSDTRPSLWWIHTDATRAFKHVRRKFHTPI